MGLIRRTDPHFSGEKGLSELGFVGLMGLTRIANPSITFCLNHDFHDETINTMVDPNISLSLPYPFQSIQVTPETTIVSLNNRANRFIVKIVVQTKERVSVQQS